eukprot:m.343552 g.343552  ORF g.343552 m.343552 type:complete len:145 (-) comp20632_c0_seq4:2733-3167(-)
MVSTAILLATACCFAQAFAQDVYHSFQAKPGTGKQTEIVKSKDGSVSCVFEYSCNGGTGEKWNIALYEEDCTVSNDSGSGESYLFFDFFKLTVDGAKPHDFVLAPGGPEGYQVTDDGRGIESSKSFGHQVNKVGIHWPNGRTEL